MAAQILILSQKIALNLERGVWHFLVIVFKKTCYFCSDSGKQGFTNRPDEIDDQKVNQSIDGNRLWLVNWHQLALANRFPIDNHTKVLANFIDCHSK